MTRGDGRITAGRETIVPADITTFVELEFGSFTSIASGLKIVSGQHPHIGAPRAVSTFPFREHGWGEYPPCFDGGKVVVGSDVWIGEDVSILAGTRVGHGATLAARAVVTRNVPPYSLVAGNPAAVRKFRFNMAIVDKLLNIAWWDWPDEKIKEVLPRMADIDAFLND